MSGQAIKDVIDWHQVERLLAQHKRYEVGRLTLVRAILDEALWYVYDGPLEAHVVLGEPCQPFPNLAAALEWAMAPGTLERFERLDAGSDARNERPES